MFKPAQMNKLRVMVLDQYLEDVTRELSKLGKFHVIDAKGEEKFKELEAATAGKTTDKCAALLARVYYLMDVLDIVEERDFFGSLKKDPKPMAWKDESSEKQLAKAESMLAEIEKTVIKKTDLLVGIGEEKARLVPERKVLEALSKLKAEAAWLGESRFLYVTAGHMDTGDLALLEKALKKDGREYLLKHVSSDENSSIIVAAPKEYKADLEKMLGTLDYEAFTIKHEKTEESLKHVKARLSEIDREEKRLKKELAEDRARHEYSIFAVREIVQIEKNLSDSVRYMVKTKRVYVLEGWVPAKNVKRLISRVEEASEGCASVSHVKITGKDDIPISLENPGVFKPFETLVETFGLPAYNEIDPTPIVALTFPIFYGLMFGDVGHGLILLFLGLLVQKIARKAKGTYNLGVIVFYCGITAMFFGFMYGEIFGMAAAEQTEILVDRLGLGSIFPLPTLWVSPLHNAMSFLTAAVVIGAIHIGSGFTLSFLNKFFVEKKPMAAIAGPMPKMLLYYTAILFILGYATGNMAPLVDQAVGTGMAANISILLAPISPLVIPFLGICVLWILFSEVIKHLPHFDTKHLPAHLGEGAFEVFDTSLILLSNSISYSRIFALALVHGGLFLALFKVAAPLIDPNLTGVVAVFTGLIWLAIILVGTAGALALESIIVFLHSLRLHYYEWFMKFFGASGSKYAPMTLERVYTKNNR